MPVLLRFVVSLCLLVSVAACGTTPLGVVASVEAERRQGEEAAPAFLQANGGLYEDPDLQAYLDQLTVTLTEAARVPQNLRPIAIGILNTSVPNAYTVQGGTIYISRGMIALANDEAELAGIIAHEIVHVSARHIAKRLAAAERIVTDVARNARADLNTGSSRTRRLRLLEQGIEARIDELSSFSQAQELEADRVAITTLTEARYDPSGLSAMLARLERWKAFKTAKLGFDPASSVAQDEYSAYPDTAYRVSVLSDVRPGGKGGGAQDRLMAALDGMPAEDRYQGGVIRGGRYINTQTGFSFEVPPGSVPLHGLFTQFASADGVIGFRLQQWTDAPFETIVDAMRADGIVLGEVRRFDAQGIAAISAGGSAAGDESGEITFLDLGGSVGIVATGDSQGDGVDAVKRRLIASLRREEPGTSPPPQIYRTRRVAAGETIAGIARSSGLGDGGEEWLRIINGLGPDAPLTAGDWIKIIQ